MCLPIIGLVVGIVGSLAQYAMTSAIAKQQAEIEKTQLRTEIENERIRSMGATNDRLEELRKAESTNRAAISATGIETNLSYEHGIAPYNQKVASRDVGRDQFNSGQVVHRKRYEIAVAGWKAKATSATALADAGASIFGQLGKSISQVA